MMVNFRQGNSSNICMSPSASTSNRVRYFTTCKTHEGQCRRVLVSGRSNASYQLSGIAGCLFSSKTFANNQNGLILLRMVNISAVSYINQKGNTHTHSTQLSNLGWCPQRQLAIQAEHLPASVWLQTQSPER